MGSTPIPGSFRLTHILPETVDNELLAFSKEFDSVKVADIFKSYYKLASLFGILGGFADVFVISKFYELRAKKRVPDVLMT